MNDINNLLNGQEEPLASEQMPWSQEMPSAADIEAAESLCQMEPNRANHTAMALLGICILSMGGLFLISRYQKPREASAQELAAEAQVDTALAKLVDLEQKEKTKKLFADADQMVEAFYQYPVSQQVSLEELQKNPFSLRSGSEEETKDTSGQMDNSYRRKRELENKVENLELQSIIIGSAGGTCFINGEIYRVGATINNLFQIKSIKSEKVLLQAEGIEFILGM